MFHLVDNLQDKSGNALAGYYVKLKVPGGAYATLYADTSRTPILSVSGIANTAITDANGRYDMYVDDGTYDVEFFDKNDVNQRILTVSAVPLLATTFIQSGTGATTRTLEAKARERVSILDFGADSTGVADSTAAFLAAIAAGHAKIHVPKGIFKISNLGVLQNAGLQIVGDSRFNTELRVAVGTTGAIFYHPTTGNVGIQTSYGIAISDLFINLNGQNVTAIDLGGINNSTVCRVRVTGGTSLGTATGVAVRCAAPDDAGSYTNKIVDCDATYMARAFVAEVAGNENTFDNCEAIVSAIGFDVASGVDTARIIGGRAEGCTTGLRTGGRETVVVGCRFEANTAADVEFVAGSERPTFIGCYTASSPTTFLNENLSTGLFSQGGTFPRRNIEPNISSPMLNSGRTTFAPAGTAPVNSSAATDYAQFVQGYQLVAQTGSIEFENGTAPNADNRVLFANVDSNNRISIPGFDRKAGAYTRIFVGNDWNFNPGVGLEWAGVKVLGAQQAAITDDASGAANQAKVNAILAALRAHGLIAT